MVGHDERDGENADVIGVAGLNTWASQSITRPRGSEAEMLCALASISKVALAVMLKTDYRGAKAGAGRPV